MSEERDYVAEATEQGWSPDKDSLPEGKWVDAQTFVEKGERIMLKSGNFRPITRHLVNTRVLYWLRRKAGMLNSLQS
ncbi:MAG: hypothetical protein ACYSW3_27230 [Planctomycetota bacterium]